MRNSYLIYGIDVEALAKIQDVIMVENFALPGWDEARQTRLANNALTIRNTREFVRDQAHLSVLSYDVGIGFDPVYPPRRHQQGIGEAAACGASMTIKGTEYNDGERMTLLTDRAYHAQHKAIGEYHRWLEAHVDLYQDRTNTAPVGLLHPEEDLWRHWMEMAAIYYGAGQALTHAGISWRVVRKGDPVDGLSALLTFTHADRDFETGDPSLTQIHVPDLPEWAWRKLSAVAKGGLWHDLVEGIGMFLLRSYHGNKLARRIMDKMNMAKLVTQTTLFDLPERATAHELLKVLLDDIYPQVDADQPVLIEIWQKGDQQQVHLLNHGPEPQMVTVQFASPVNAIILSPDAPESLTLEGETLECQILEAQILEPQTLSIYLNIYSILILG